MAKVDMNVEPEKTGPPQNRVKEVPAIKGTATVKTTVGSKLVRAIISDEVHDVKDYIIYDVLIPAIKTTFRNVLMNAIDLTFFGSTNTRDDSPYTSYSEYSRNGRRRNRDAYRDERRSRRLNIDIRHLDRVEFSYKEDALDAIDFLNDNIDVCGYATVGDFLSVAKLPSTSIHSEWGWYDITGAEPIYSTSGKWFVRLPKPRPLE